MIRAPSNELRVPLTPPGAPGAVSAPGGRPPKGPPATSPAGGYTPTRRWAYPALGAHRDHVRRGPTRRWAYPAFNRLRRRRGGRGGPYMARN